MLALVLGDRPLRTGLWFYLGALSAMLAIGVAAAFVLGDSAASGSSTPKTWVMVVNVVAGAFLVVFVLRFLRRPVDPDKTAAMIARMSAVASSPAIAIVGAGAVLANAGGFILPPSPSRRSRSKIRPPLNTSPFGPVLRSSPFYPWAWRFFLY